MTNSFLLSTPSLLRATFLKAISNSPEAPRWWSEMLIWGMASKGHLPTQPGHPFCTHSLTDTKRLQRAPEFQEERENRNRGWFCKLPSASDLREKKACHGMKPLFKNSADQEICPQDMALKSHVSYFPSVQKTGNFSSKIKWNASPPRPTRTKAEPTLKVTDIVTDTESSAWALELLGLGLNSGSDIPPLIGRDTLFHLLVPQFPLL